MQAIMDWASKRYTKEGLTRLGLVVAAILELTIVLLVDCTLAILAFSGVIPVWVASVLVTASQFLIAIVFVNLFRKMM